MRETLEATPAKTAWDRWMILWGALLYGLLIYATFTAISFGSHSPSRTVVILLLVAALAGWHAYRQLRRGGQNNLTYFLGAGILWAALMVADPGFLILALGIFAPLCFHDLRWGAVALIGTGGVWIWLEWREQGSIPWASVIGVTLFLFAGLLAVGYSSAISRESRERQRLIEQLRRTQANLAEAERQAGMLEERHRLARDIHDTLTQGFASIVMLLEAAIASLGDHPTRRHVERALQSARDNLTESRRLVWAMRPAGLADDSLPDALGRLASRLAEEGDIRTETVVTGTVRPLDLAHETALLRVAQESFTNVRKHAQATKVTLTLSYMDDVVVLDIQDDGVGFAAGRKPAKTGVGLRAMRERVEPLGGTVSVESAPGEGMTVVVHLPTSQGQPLGVAADDGS